MARGFLDVQVRLSGTPLLNCSSSMGVVMTTLDGTGTRRGGVTSRSTKPIKSSTAASASGSTSTPTSRTEVSRILKSMREQVDEAKVMYKDIKKFWTHPVTLHQIMGSDFAASVMKTSKKGYATSIFGVPIFVDPGVPQWIAIADYGPIKPTGGSIIREDLEPLLTSLYTKSFPGYDKFVTFGKYATTEPESATIYSEGTKVTDVAEPKLKPAKKIKFKSGPVSFFGEKATASGEPIGEVTSVDYGDDDSITYTAKFSGKGEWTLSEPRDYIDATTFGSTSKTYFTSGLRDIEGTFVGASPLEKMKKEEVWAERIVEDQEPDPDSIFGKALAKARAEKK